MVGWLNKMWLVERNMVGLLMSCILFALGGGRMCVTINFIDGSTRNFGSILTNG